MLNYLTVILSGFSLAMMWAMGYIHNHPEQLKEPVTFNLPFLFVLNLLIYIGIVYLFSQTNTFYENSKKNQNS